MMLKQYVDVICELDVVHNSSSNYIIIVNIIIIILVVEIIIVVVVEIMKGIINIIAVNLIIILNYCKKLLKH